MSMACFSLNNLIPLVGNTLHFQCRSCFFTVLNRRYRAYIPEIASIIRTVSYFCRCSNRKAVRIFFAVVAGLSL